MEDGCKDSDSCCSAAAEGRLERVDGLGQSGEEKESRGEKDELGGTTSSVLLLKDAEESERLLRGCLLYTSDAADE